MRVGYWWKINRREGSGLIKGFTTTKEYLVAESQSWLTAKSLATEKGEGAQNDGRHKVSRLLWNPTKRALSHVTFAFQKPYCRDQRSNSIIPKSTAWLFLHDYLTHSLRLQFSTYTSPQPPFLAAESALFRTFSCGRLGIISLSRYM